jgi:hypothetical protein
MRVRLLLTVAALAAMLLQPLPALADDCEFRGCAETPEVGTSPGSLTASYFEARGTVGYASNSSPALQPYHWRLRTQCQISDPNVGGCNRDQATCESPADRVIGYYVVQRQPVVLPDRSSIDGIPPPADLPVGAGFGLWSTVFGGCVDVTDLNPPPSPGEVFRYFQTLPLPLLTTRQQPPGNALVGLPVIFWTDSPTNQTFTVDIRGFQVVIVATASGYTWHTGDGADLTTDEPGQPYPHQSITHDYRAGTYTASLTTTWSATFSVDSGASADVPGTTTTDGPPVTFTVLQARTVLTNPYD